MAQVVLGVLGLVGFLVGAGTVWQARPPRDERRAQSRSLASAQEPAPNCPFCGHQMQPGRIYSRSGSPTIWQPPDGVTRRWYDTIWSWRTGPDEKVVVGLANQRTRGASTCTSCDAVVIDPADR